MDFLQQAYLNENYMVDCRRSLHQIPELNNNLPQTIAYVCHQLDALNVEYRVVDGGGIIATIGNKDCKTFLLRADMDALPIEEKSGEPFTSANGNMHACGHDIHTARLLGAAKMLKEHEADIKGCVKLVFQCDEEGITGMANLISNGVLENPSVQAGMALHVLPGDVHVGQYYE